MIANHSVISHLHHDKQLVPFNTFTSSRADFPQNFNARFFGGIAFGTNVFYDATQMLISRSALFRCFSRGYMNISVMIRLLYIFASLQLVLPFHYALEITCCLMPEFLVVFLLDVHRKMRLCAHRHV
jgi:hypothetical protein